MNYLDAYNRHDKDGVSFLDPNLKVFLYGKLVAEGVEACLPAYLKDFKEGSTVTLQQVIGQTETEMEVSIRVVLVKDEKITVEMNYVFSKESKLMIRHELEKVEQ